MRRYVSMTSAALGLMAVSTLPAYAQFYTPPTEYAHQAHHPGGAGIDLGLTRQGFYPAIRAGIGPIGVGIGAGLGHHGLGTGANLGVGPLGATVNSGLGHQGLGLASRVGIGNTGLSADAGLSPDGLGMGASASVLGFGPGVSASIGHKGPGLGASVGFGPLGTLQIGSHANTYPSAQQTGDHFAPNNSASYYLPAQYGNAPYYAQPQKNSYAQSACGPVWTC